MDLDLWGQLNRVETNADVRDATLNPVSDTSNLGNQIWANYAIAADNIGNFMVNSAEKDRAILAKRRVAKQKIANNPKLNAFEKMWATAKTDFTDYNDGTTYLEAKANEAKLWQKDIEQKARISGINQGSAGILAGDIVSELPLFTIGTFRRIEKAGEGLFSTLTHSATTKPIDVAKAVVADTAENAITVGGSTFLANKAFGKSDAEASSSAVAATAFMGGFGSIYGTGKVVSSKISNSFMSDMKSAAGGGDMTAEEARAIASASEKISQRVKMQSVEDTVQQDSKALEDNDPSAMPNVNRISKEFFDDQGRQYSEANLLSHQGQPVEKSKVARENFSSENHKAFVESAIKANDAMINNLESYGKADARFSSLKPMSDIEKEEYRINFKIDLYKDVIENTDSKVLKKRYNDLLTEEQVRLNDLNAPKKSDIDIATKEEIDKLKFQKFEAKDYADDITAKTESIKAKNQEGYGFGSFHGEMKDIHPEEREMRLIKAVEENMDKQTFVTAVNDLQTRVANQGSKLVVDPDNLTLLLRSKFPEETAKIKNYRDRAYDIDQLKEGKLSHEEFAWREEQRIQSDVNIASKAKEGVTKEELDKFISDSNAKLEALGRKPIAYEISPKKQSSGKQFTKEDDIVDNKLIREIKSKAYDRYLNTGEISRYTSSKSKTGDKVITDAERADLDEYVSRGILTKEQVLDKHYPIGKKQSEISSSKEISRQEAKDSIKEYWGKTFGFKGDKGSEHSIKHRSDVYDASNSVGQIVTALTGDVKLAKSVMTKEGETEFRVKIADYLSNYNNGEFSKYAGGPITKDMVKAVYTPKTYGSMDKGAAEGLLNNPKTPWFKDIVKTKGKDEAIRVANEFVREFNTAMSLEAKGITDFMKEIEKIHINSKTGEHSYTLPDGHKVSFQLKESNKYNVVDNGKVVDTIDVKGSGADKFSRALMPRILQSIDAYIARSIRNKFGIDTTHDAFHIPKGMQTAVDKEYRRLLKELHDTNYADKLFKELGGEGYQQEGKINKFFWYDKDRKFITPEHLTDVIETIEKKSYDELKAGKQLTSTEATLMYMTTKSSRSHDYHSMVDGMIDEAVHSSKNMSIARIKDDPFERALAYALQGKELTAERMVKAPDNLTKDGMDAWYKTQKVLWARFRSAAEYNANLRGAIQGKRMFFDEKGLFIGGSIADLRELRNLQAKRLHQIANSKVDLNVLADKRLAVVDDINNGKVVNSDDVNSMILKEVQGEEDMNRFADGLTDISSLRDSIVADIKASNSEPKYKYDDFVSDAKKSLNDSLKHIKDKYNSTKEYQQFSDLLRTTRPGQMLAEEAGDTTKKMVDALLTDAEQDLFLKHIVNTDAIAVMHMSSEDMAALFDKHALVYNKYKKHIDAMARGIGRNENKTGYFMNNAHVLKDEHAIDIDAKELDQLISIVALKQSDSFKFLEEAKNNPNMLSVMEMLKANAIRQEAHFRVDNQLHNMQKGYIQDSYENAKEFDPRTGTFRHNAEASYEGGALGFDTMSSRVGGMPKTDAEGVKYTRDDVPAGMDPYEFAEKNNLKLTPRGFVSVADFDWRTNLGLKRKLSTMIGNTEASIRKKEAQFNSYVEILTSDDNRFGKLFSQDQKDGFVAITKEQAQKIPPYARDYIKFVNPDYAEKILGRDHIQVMSKIFEKYTGKEAPYELRAFDDIVKASVGIFKKNVVLTSISSFKNGFLVNYSTYALLGGGPKGMIKHSKEAWHAYNEFKRVTVEYDKALASGKMTDDIKHAYEDNEVVQLLKDGLSINTLDGVRSDSNIINNFFSEATGGKFDGITNTIMFNQGTFTGDGVKRAFAQIDFVGRYMAFKRLRETADASTPNYKLVREVNDLFGQMDEIAPALIDVVDKYGVAVFAKWAASVLPETARVIKQNPKKAALIGISLLMLGDYGDVNTDTINPVTSVLDYPVDAMHGDGIAWKQRNMPKLIPGVWRKMFDIGESYSNDEDVNYIWGQRLTGENASASVMAYEKVKEVSSGM